MIPKIKISENTEKITNPGFKQVYRLFSRESGEAVADVLTLHGEEIDDTKPYEIFDPEHTWKRKLLTNFKAEKLTTPIYEQGKLVYNRPNVHAIRAHCAKELERLWDEVKRFEFPHKYYVDLSQNLWEMRHQLLEQHSVE